MIRYGLALVLACCPLGAMAADVQQDYALNAGDVLDVSVWNEAELRRDVVVLPDGFISFPLAGSIAARGRTASEVQETIREKLRAYVTEPVVTVSVKAVVGNKVYVIGQVNKPGELALPNRVSVVQALSMAGGLTPYADEDDIMVIRQSGASETAIPFQYSDIKRGRSLETNITLHPGDVVIVPSAGLF